MTTCSDLERSIAREADGTALTPAEREQLHAHLAGCAPCRTALDAQRAVARLVAARPADGVPASFASSLASRLDEEEGWLGIANWRAWTAGLAPVAAALLVAAYLGIGAGPTATTSPAVEAVPQVVSIDPETHPAAAALLQPPGTMDALLETMLTGAVGSRQ